MDTTTLEARGGWLYIVRHDALWEKPVLVHAWFPLEVPLSVLVTGYSREACGQEMTCRGPGSYTSPAGQWYRLPQGGATCAAFQEQEEVPRPRTRAETRWRDGRWQKYIGRRWVAA